MTKVKELRIKAEIVETLDEQLISMEENIGYDYRKDEETGDWEKVKISNEDLSEYDIARLNIIRQIRSDLLKLI